MTGNPLRTKRMAAALAAVAVVAGTLASAPVSASAASPPATTTTTTTLAAPSAGGIHFAVDIRRTEYGIPHILAGDYPSLGYGYGYAFAQDNICVMADRMLTVSGDRSQFLGPTAIVADPLAGRTTNLQSDLYYQSVRQSGLVQRLLAQPAPLGPTAQVRQMVDGYVAGYNRYLRATGVANLPDATCRGQAWVRPITATDLWDNILDVDRITGTAHFKAPIADAAPPAAGTTAGTTATSAAPSLSALLSSTTQTENKSLGSNGWALGKDATAGHDGMLLANPHYPWAGYARFYQVQLTIPGKIDVTGASLYGSPVVEIGHTNGLAWTHTVSTANRFTLYQLTLAPGDPTSYLVDGKVVPMTRQKVSVTVRGTDGKLSTVVRTLYGTKYGPVLANGWTATSAVALDDANADNLRSMNEWLAMDTSQNLDQLHKAQDTYQAIPFINTIATDSSGTAFYGDAGVVPNVTDAEAARCIDTPAGRQAFPERFIMDGSTSACAWGTDPDAITPGIFGPSRYPQLTRGDYVANSNDSAWLTNPAALITGYPAIYGDTGTPRSLRTRLGLTMIGQRLAGTDGLGAPGFTLSDLQTVELNDRNLSAELARDAVVAMCEANPVLTADDGTRVDVGAACSALAAWDGRGDAGSHGGALWQAFFTQLANSFNQQTWWQVPFDPAHPVTTPGGFVADDPNVRHALADTVQQFTARKIPVDATPGDVHQWDGVPLNGCSDEEGCFDVVGASPDSGQNSSVADGAFGSSFIMTVELTPSGPHARTILTYSESSNPSSPHYTDQTVLFSHKQWVTERFSEAEIYADPQLRSTILIG
ncbi:acyl-homoserine-lactone acylase [Catenulispora sp. GAS73]|uniref:penicillin acylase family protein n=1 Tax=Catenulispora sp. GAS73 TaxID=3156269 RepID=UPI0035171956